TAAAPESASARLPQSASALLRCAGNNAAADNAWGAPGAASGAARSRRAVAVDPRAEEQQRIRLGGFASLRGTRERGTDHVESAGERQRRGSVASDQQIALDVRLQLEVDRLDRVVQLADVAQPFALLQAKLGAAPLGIRDGA